ncbi:hypothetical protein C6N18_15555 [Acinetobacter baumannii]|nr:hypothetical protein C6N18_15555 [Acinetobacter baumannii]
MSREELIYCIEKFIDKNDISIKNTQRIEVLLDDLNSEEEIIESMFLILALYFLKVMSTCMVKMK